MKKLSMMIMAACLLLLASCSLKPKSIAPTSTKFDGGKLATLVELVGTEGELSFEETEAAVPVKQEPETVPTPALLNVRVRIIWIWCCYENSLGL